MAVVYTPGTLYTATSQVTSVNLKALVSSMTITGLGTSQIDTAATSFVQIISGDAGATTTEGAALWNKTTDRFGISDGTTWVNHVQGEALATQPRLLTNYLWFDTTLGIQRVYITRNGLLGFHPIENGYLLVNNGSGADLAAGDVVVTDYATGANHVKATTTVKDQTVIGVCLEAITNGSSGIIATYGCPKNITVNIDETDGALAVGDLIVSYSATNRGRTVGPPVTSAYASSTIHVTGFPFGAFAVALTTVAANQATARMLNQVGGGAHVKRGRSALTSTAIATTYIELDISAAMVTSKHAPAVSADLNIQVTGDAGGTGDEYSITVELSPNKSTVAERFKFTSQSASSGSYDVCAQTTIPTVNDTTTPTALGNKTSIHFIDNAGDVSTLLATDCVGYTY